VFSESDLYNVGTLQLNFTRFAKASFDGLA